MQNLNVDIAQTSGVTCDECGGVYFDQALVLRKASAILTGTGKPGYIPIPVFAFEACSHVNTALLPREIQSLH